MNPDGGFLCIGCLEGRLGRALCCDDFTDAQLNDLTDVYNQVLMERGRFSPRLIDRLSTPGQHKSPRRALVSRRLVSLRPGEGEVPDAVDGLPVIEDKMVGATKKPRAQEIAPARTTPERSGARGDDTDPHRKA
jgi:hypothetical protein